MTMITSKWKGQQNSKANWLSPINGNFQSKMSYRCHIILQYVRLKVKQSKSKVYVNLYSASPSEPLMRSRDHLSFGITQCYLPPSRGDSSDFTPAFTSTHFTVLRKVKGWVDLGTAVRVLYIAVVVVINTKPQWASILGPNTPQLSILPLDHCDLRLRDVIVPPAKLGRWPMPLQTESTFEPGKDWHQQPTSVSVQQSSSAAHNGSE